MTYLDTSALVKRFIAEKGSPSVRTLMQKDLVATAKIAYAEIYAAFARKNREGFLSNRQLGRLSNQFESDWSSYIRLDLTDEILHLARDLTGRYPLRAFDAIHLASAVTLRDALDELIPFAAADQRLIQAAQAENFRIVELK